MKWTIYTAIFVLLLSCKTHQKFIVKTDFKNQGEQEDYWAEKLFAEQYKQQNIKRYSGSIEVIGTDKIYFGISVIHLNNQTSLKNIFTSGLFYPGLVGRDDLKISELEEVTSLSHSIKVKRFRFWGWTPGIINPTVFFFEITNSRATPKMGLAEFIKGGKLTFVKEGWIII